MVTINNSTIRSNIYETVYDSILSAKAVYGSSLSPSWVPTLYGGMPDLDSISFPSIIIMPVNVDESEFTIDTARSTTNKDITVNIVLFAKKNKDLDYLSDGISGTMKNTMTGIMLSETSESFNLVYPNEQKIKSKTMNFIFKRR